MTLRTQFSILAVMMFFYYIMYPLANVLLVAQPGHMTVLEALIWTFCWIVVPVVGGLLIIRSYPLLGNALFMVLYSSCVMFALLFADGARGVFGDYFIVFLLMGLLSFVIATGVTVREYWSQIVSFLKPNRNDQYIDPKPPGF